MSVDLAVLYMDGVALENCGMCVVYKQEEKEPTTDFNGFKFGSSAIYMFAWIEYFVNKTYGRPLRKFVKTCLSL